MSLQREMTCGDLKTLHLDHNCKLICKPETDYGAWLWDKNSCQMWSLLGKRCGLKGPLVTSGLGFWYLLVHAS